MSPSTKRNLTEAYWTRDDIKKKRNNVQIVFEHPQTENTFPVSSIEFI